MSYVILGLLNMATKASKIAFFLLYNHHCFYCFNYTIFTLDSPCQFKNIFPFFSYFYVCISTTWARGGAVG